MLRTFIQSDNINVDEPRQEKIEQIDDINVDKSSDNQSVIDVYDFDYMNEESWSDAYDYLDSQSVVDSFDYRQIVLEIILQGHHVSKDVYELRLSLFIQAANYYFEHGGACLEPFPSCFFDQFTKTRKYNDLKKHILTIPPLTSDWVRNSAF